MTIILLLLTLCSMIMATPSALPGFSLTWSDDFMDSQNGMPSTTNWRIMTGTCYPGGPPSWGTGEVQTYTSSHKNLRVTADGYLEITPRRDANGHWTSAKIETSRCDFQAQPGGRMRTLARIRLPDVTGEAAAGYWPAFWTLGDKFREGYHGWPTVGEFDVMENINGLDRVYVTMHCGDEEDGPCHEKSGRGGYRPCPGPPCRGNFHEYTVEVDRGCSPQRLNFFIDGEWYFSTYEHEVGAEVWAEVLNHGHFLLLNVAMGGAFPDSVRGGKTPTPATVPGKSMLVDWVTVYNSI